MIRETEVGLPRTWPHACRDCHVGGGKAKTKELAGWREAGVWNGTEDTGGVVYTSSPTIVPRPARCTFRLSSKRVTALSNKELVLPVVLGLLEIWPALTLEVSPYKYTSVQEVFPDRPGVGWMLYCPRC
ncbi:hypothetical protein [Ralstonia pseudosolanacearum]|uniref:hypothetical protein n=1 Tax=Ralstonia pseudosolanacearum TaxID=1310165 RepID=UPI003C2F8AFC